MQADFVLGKWQKDEIPLVRYKIEKAVDAIESFAAIGLERTMSMMNNLNISLPQ